MITAERPLADIMIWSMKLNEVEHVEERSGNNLSNDSDLKQHKNNQATIKFQETVISGLIEMNKRWEDRISSVESELKRPKEGDVHIFSAIHSCEGPMDEGENSCVKNKRRKKAATSLLTVWYECTLANRVFGCVWFLGSRCPTLERPSPT